MPSEKRSRQRAMREVRDAHERRRRGRRRMARRGALGAVATGVVILLVVLLSATPAKKTTPSTTTTTGSSATTSSTAPSTKTASGYTTVSTPVAPTCPPVNGAAKRYIAFTSAPPTCIDATKTYSATVKTDVGTFVIDLSTADSAKAVNNFVFLSRYHFYDSTIFHRVIPGFMDQGGDPTGTGTGGPGYSWTGNAPAKACQKTNSCYPIDSIAMANSGALSSNGSQFFIMAAKSYPLPPDYTRFGTVVSGTSVIAKINADGSTSGTPPKVTHHIISVTITQS